MKKILIALVVVVTLAIGVNFLSPAIRSTKSLPRITYTEAFNQEEAEYFVYFWQENCSFCIEFEPDVVAAAKAGIPIYVVDMQASENSNAWYDWPGHHERNTRVIGEYRSGEKVFFEGESEELYSSEEGWVISTSEGQIIAKLNRATNNREPQTAEEIEVSGTPGLLRVIHGQFAGYSEGVADGQALLDLYGEE